MDKSPSIKVLFSATAPLPELSGQRMEININDALNDSVDVDSFDIKLQSTLNGQNAIMDRIAEIEKQQTTFKDSVDG